MVRRMVEGLGTAAEAARETGRAAAALGEAASATAERGPEGEVGPARGPERAAEAPPAPESDGRQPAAEPVRISPRAALSGWAESGSLPDAGEVRPGTAGERAGGRLGEIHDFPPEVRRWEGGSDGVPAPRPDLAAGQWLQVYHVDERDRPRVAEGWVGSGERAPRGAGGAAEQRAVSGPYNVLARSERPDEYRWEESWRDRDVTLHGSHLIAHSHAGADGAYNMVALPSEQNQREMRRIETEIDRMLGQGSRVYVHAYVSGYLGDSRIPEEVTVRLFTQGSDGALHPAGPPYSIVPTRVH